MAIAPITGKLRKRFWVDLTTALGLGVGAGYAYWFVFFNTRLSPSQSKLTERVPGMAFTSRAVSPDTRCDYFFKSSTNALTPICFQSRSRKNSTTG